MAKFLCNEIVVLGSVENMIVKNVSLTPDRLGVLTPCLLGVSPTPFYEDCNLHSTSLVESEVSENG